MDFASTFVTTTRSDGNGQWFVDAGDSIAPGFHQVLVSDEAGHQSISPIYLEGAAEPIIIVQDQPVWYTRIQNILPPVYAYAILGLLFLLILSTRGIFWIGERAERRIPGRKRVFQVLAWVVVFVIVTAAALGALFLNRQLPANAPAFPGVPVPIVAPTPPIDVRGSVVAPFGMAPIAGIDLTLGETSIRTSGSGQFAFPSAHAGDRIRISHPQLKRAYAWRLSNDSKTIVIPFDVKLYNAMNDVMEKEARGPQTASSFYGPEHISDQSIVITGIRFEDRWQSPKTQAVLRLVAEVDAFNGAITHTYNFTFQNGVWESAY